MLVKIERRERLEVREIKGWRLIYGRKKVGKTFLAINCLDHDEYYLVSRELTLILNWKDELSLEEGVKKVVSYLRGRKTVVLDEFQRLPEKYYDWLASAYPNGTLVLLGSSLGVVHRVVEMNSPSLASWCPTR
jgi:AAA+ ATPase superfamily predicted ATPase